MFKKTTHWFITVFIALIISFFFMGKSLLSDNVIFISVLSGIVALYLSKNRENKGMSKKRRALYFSLGFLIVALSFINQISELLGAPIIFWNPPYSMGEFGVLLSGLSVMYFSLLRYRPILLPVSFPAIVVIVYQIYRHYKMYVEWVAAPLLGPTTSLSVTVLNLVGIKATASSDYVITFLTQDGVRVGVQIVIDCTGIWSLSAFTASLILVSIAFPKVFSRRGAFFIAVGYLGTYASNILRVVAICVSAYLYGHSGMTLATHVHAGWIAFSGWMVIFWYFFFSRYLLKDKKKQVTKFTS